jgi:hypothetical protein
MEEFQTKENLKNEKIGKNWKTKNVDKSTIEVNIKKFINKFYKRK